MGNGLTRVALWALVLIVLASTLATIPGAQAGSPTNTLLGYVKQAGGAAAPPVPAGVNVDLIDSATHANYTTTTSTSSGEFTFTDANTANSIVPGWYGVWVPPQVDPSLYGCAPCAVLPADQNPQYVWESQSSLTSTTSPVTIGGVQLDPLNATIWGNVTGPNGKPAGGATVELLAPDFNNFVLASNTSATVANATYHYVKGTFSLAAPWGSWILETIVPGSPPSYSYLQANVNADQITVNPAVGSYTVWGYADQAGGAPVPSGGNVTVFDPTNGLVYSSVTPAGGFYSVGTYPADFTGPGPQSLIVTVAPVGYQTVSYGLSISATNTSGGANPHIVTSAAIAPPARYNTTLNFTAGFGKVNVTTNATLLNDSVFPDLANASIGQLWAQLALDWQNGVTFSAANLPGVVSWVNSSGPFFAAGQSDLTVNGTGFGQPTNFSLSDSSSCTTTCGLSSDAWLDLNWSQAYNVTAALPTSTGAYSLSMTFRHPTNDEAFNYTVVLPAPYVLAAGASAPAQTKLAPAGPGGTWTSFTLVSEPSTSPSGTATFSIVKYANITANVNASSANFAFSQANVLNSTHGNYTAIVGVNENVTFSGANSTFPAGSNGTLYQWNFGDGSFKNTSQPSTYHIYTTAGDFVGSLGVTSSGGLTNSTGFRIFTDDEAPIANISVNTTVQTASNGARYVLINWSTTLHLNASMTTDQVFSGANVTGVLSGATWAISSYGYAQTSNYSVSQGAKVFSNLTRDFTGAGHYVTASNFNDSAASVAFLGWQYNVSLKVFDVAGHAATTELYVLVRDTEKPTPVLVLQNSAGATVTSAGIVEGTNHTAEATLNGANSSDPHNGTVLTYTWVVSNAGNSSYVNRTFWENASASLKAPTSWPHAWLSPQTKPYTVNLTVTDRAANSAYTRATLTIAINATTRPILSVTNLTAPSSMNEGSSYTVWANITNTVGQNSTAMNLSVLFYLLPPSGSGSQVVIGGSPTSVLFYNYTSNTTTSSVPWGGAVDLPYNHTVRAQISYNPGLSGNYDLWVNATATNEFVSDYANGANTAQVPVTLNQNQLSTDLIYVVIGVVAVIVIVGLFLYLRRRDRPSSSGKSSKGTSGGSKPAKESPKDSSKDSKKDDDE
jgi:hypothetical protein